MPMIQEFEKHKYKLPATGDGFGDIFSGVSNIAEVAMQNKDAIIDAGKSVGAVAGAASKIADAVKAAKRLDELRENQRIKEAQAQAQKSTPRLAPEVKQKIQDLTTRNKSGDGFEKF